MAATKRLIMNLTLAGILLLPTFLLWAHPMPNSVVLLNVRQQYISGEIQIPLSELQSALGQPLSGQPERLVDRLGATLKTYLLRHVRPYSFEGKPWSVSLGAMHVASAQDSLRGQYHELIVAFRMSPPPHADIRNFYFYYDAVVHQVITHKILVAVRQDWQQGLLAHEPATTVGVIEWDIPQGKVLPFQVSIQQGSSWQGFRKMFTLGRHHIAEGTDHLLFLLVLLLPAFLATPTHSSTSRWGGFGGIRYGLWRLVRIITAFTLGHSLTLVLAATGWVRLPAQPIETLIAVSILVSAIHAYRPVFSGKEVWIAAGFGLIHGLAFAETLVDLDLDLTQMLLSVLGFNLGIECMQLLIVGLTVPWLILLSQTPYYQYFRVLGALGVSVAALAWVAERISGQSNFIAQQVEQLAAYPLVWLGLLALSSVGAYFRQKKLTHRML